MGKEGDGAAKRPKTRTRGALRQVGARVWVLPGCDVGIWPIPRPSARLAWSPRQAPTFAPVAAKGPGGSQVGGIPSGEQQHGDCTRT